jgi:hypothetical protein
MFCSNKHYVSGDFCHLCGETLKEKKVPVKGINRVSKNMQKTLAEYRVLRKKFLEENPRCEVFSKLKSEEIHHSRGKLGDLYLDTRYWKAVSRLGHTWIHDNMIEAQKLGLVFLRNVETKEDENNI